VLPRDIVDRIKDETDIVSLVREYVTLRQAGTAFKGLCPFHRDSNPSLHVNPQRQIYKCFACGEGGDAISFLMKLQGMTFPESLEVLARPLNIDLSRFLIDNDESEGERQSYFRACEEAAGIWTAALWSDAGKEARSYLMERGFSEEILRRFDVGYADGDGAAFQKKLETAGVNEELALRAGLLGRRDDRRPFAYFRKRIIFPIRNIAQRIAGFGGRITGPGEPKYLNSSESAHFTKRNLLYGFASSRIAIARGKSAILVEGYLDLIALAQAGYNNVVATCGTAFTPEQARILRRGCRNLYILFDGDKAGLKAAVKSAGIAITVGLEPQVARLPAGEDPASILTGGDNSVLATVLEDALAYLPLLRELAEDSGKGREGTERALRAAVGVITSIDDPIRRTLLISEAAEVFGISEQIITGEIKRMLDVEARRAAYREKPDAPGPDAEADTTVPAEITGKALKVDLERVEARMLAHVLADESGKAALRMLDLWSRRTFKSGDAELLHRELGSWREESQGGGNPSPSLFVQQRWYDHPDSYRGFVSALLTNQEAASSTACVVCVEETFARIDDIDQRRRGVEELRSWIGDTGDKTTHAPD
jgi:DNA primase